MILSLRRNAAGSRVIYRRYDHNIGIDDMTGTTLSSADLDPRCRKILFRAWHRGLREMDLIMGGFADAHLATLNSHELDGFEVLIEQADRDLLHWILDEADIPTEFDTPLLKAIREHHDHSAPINV